MAASGREPLWCVYGMSICATLMQSDAEANFWVDGMTKPQHEAEMPMTLQYVVEPEYLRVMQVPLLRGLSPTPTMKALRRWW